MARRRPAYLTLGVAVGSALVLLSLSGGLGHVAAESQEQGSAVEMLAVPEQRPQTDSTPGLFDDVAVPEGWTGSGSQTVTTLKVGNGDTLLAMLVGAGSAEPDAGRAVAAISDFFNLRRLQIGQVVTAVFVDGAGDQANQLNAVSLALGEADYVVANRTTDGAFVARRSDQPLDAALTAPVQQEITGGGGALVRDTQVRRGDTLMRLVVREGVGRIEADRAIRALGRLFDPQGLQIGQVLQIIVSPGADTTLLALGLQTGENSYVVAERNDSGDYVARESNAPAAVVVASTQEGTDGVAPILAALSSNGAQVERLTISRGDTLMDLMVEAGATITDAHKAARTLGRHFDPRRLQIGQTLYVVRTPGPAGSGLDVLGLVVLDAGRDGLVAVARDPESGAFVGQRIANLADLAVLAPLVSQTQQAPEASAALSDFSSDMRVELVAAASGDTLTSMLTRAGASRSEAERVVRALRPSYDPRRLQIGQEVRAVFENQTLVAVSIKLKEDLFVQADLQGNDYVAQRTTTPLNPSFVRPVAIETETVVEETGPADDDVVEAEDEDQGETADEVVLATPEVDEPARDLPLAVNSLEAEIGLSPEAEQVWFELRSGETVGGHLRTLTNNGKEISDVIATLEAEYDQSDITTGQQLIVIIDEDGAGTHIVALSLDIGARETLAVVRQHDGGYALRHASNHVDLSDFAQLEHEPAMPELLPLWPRTPAEITASATRVTTDEVEIASGGTLMNAMLDLGIDTVQADASIDVLRDIFNPRSIRAGQLINITYSGADLLGIDFSPRAGERVEVALGDDGYVAREIVLPTQRSLAAKQGTIRTSLYQAAEEAGVPLAVLADLIRAYSFDVDFQREIRTGDNFEVLYEVYSDESGNVVRYGAPLFAVLNVSGVTLPIYRYTPGSGFTDYFTDKGESVRKALLRTPVDGAKITSGFGMRDHPLLGYSRMHKGVDFGAPAGTPILAAGDGTIEFLGKNSGYGNYIRIRHNSTYKSAYAHMSRFASDLAVGSRVRQGQVIGYVGSTGLATGPHLHYEVMVNGEQINPLDIKLPSGEVLAGAELDRFYRERDDLDAQYADLLVARNVADSQ